MFWLELEPEGRTPYIRQLYDRLRLKILGGELRGGERVPSSRELAAHLRVSRNVVREAYAQLLAEGYLESRRGAGMFVAAQAALPPSAPAPAAGQPAPAPLRPEARPDAVDFRTGFPALDLIPRSLLARLYRQVCLEVPPSGYGYGDPAGHPVLRGALSDYLSRTRGIRCSPDRILVTTGMAEALFITARLLLAGNARVAVGDPMHRHYQDTLRFWGGELEPVEVDEAGLRVDALARLEQAPAFVFVTPSHQFPFGGILPVQRRIELIRFAQERGSFIVEDDYESEFYYGGCAPGPLQSMDPERVLYIGTFSKVFSPSLRTGYVVLPAPFVEGARALKYLLNYHSSTFDQLVLARLMAGGDLERHASRMKRVYRRRRDELVRALTEGFQGRCTCLGTSGGLQLVADFGPLQFTAELLEALEAGGVLLYPVERHAIRKGRYGNRVLLGFGNLPEPRIREGVRRMVRILGPRLQG